VYPPLYAHGKSPIFIEGNMFTTVLPLSVGDMDLPVFPRSTDQATDQAVAIIEVLSEGEKTNAQMMDEIGMRHRPTFRENYLDPALSQGLIEMTIPEKPDRPHQKYKLTEKGKKLMVDSKRG
jgi:ATP-dependent DNA helicase RecG